MKLFHTLATTSITAGFALYAQAATLETHQLPTKNQLPNVQEITQISPVEQRLAVVPGEIQFPRPCPPICRIYV